MGDLSALDNMCPAAGGAKLGTLLNKIITRLNQGALSTAAAATVTIAGTPAAGEIVTVTVGGTAVAYTILAGDIANPADATADRAAVAEKVKVALNANATVGALITATRAGAVVTLTAKIEGTGFNATTLATSVSAGAGVTATRQAATFGAATAGVGADDIPLLT